MSTSPFDLLLSSNAHPYAGISACLATMHAKERAIAPPFLRHLGMPVAPTTNLNTDQFGTFTGEIARNRTGTDAAIHKAKCATELAIVRFGIGSEGSFGPHPWVPFVPVEREVLAFYDRDQNICIVEYLATHKTNYAHAAVSRHEELDAFLSSIGFPSHGVVVAVVHNFECTTIAKGIRDYGELSGIVTSRLPLKGGRHLRVSTDMRAHMNPSRMGVIRALASQLARRIARLCPACQSPGFGEKSFERGVPCSWCAEPTQLVRAIRAQCASCGHFELTPVSRLEADPQHCDLCNP